MNLSTILVASVVAAVLIAIGVSAIRHRRNGSCCGNCGSCCGCHTKHPPTG